MKAKQWFQEAERFVRSYTDGMRESDFSRLFDRDAVRAFDVAGMIIDADVIDGEDLESLIERMFANESVDYLHVHNAKLGCYLALVERASPSGRKRALIPHCS